MMTGQEIVQEIEGNLHAHLAANRQAYKPASNTATTLSIPCTRFGVFARTHWENRKLIEPESKAIMEDGKALEEETVRLLRDMGLKVEETQRPYNWEKYNIGGRIDGKLTIGGKRIPFEIYSMEPYAFRRVNTWEDVKNARSIWLRKKGYQLQIYLVMGNHPEGLLILRTYRKLPKFISVPLDLEMGEEMVKRAEAINAHLQAGTIADPIPWDDQLCGHCDFLHVCLPDRVAESLIMDDPEIEIKLDRRGELEERLKECDGFHQEYDELDEDLKEKFGGIPQAIIGNWKITSKTIQRKAYQAKASEYQKVTIEKLK